MYSAVSSNWQSALGRLRNWYFSTFLLWTTIMSVFKLKNKNEERVLTFGFWICCQPCFVHALGWENEVLLEGVSRALHFSDRTAVLFPKPSLYLPKAWTHAVLDNWHHSICRQFHHGASGWQRKEWIVKTFQLSAGQNCRCNCILSSIIHKTMEGINTKCILQ